MSVCIGIHAKELWARHLEHPHLGLGDPLNPQLITRDSDPRLLVGNESRDDTAVVDIGNGMSIIGTTDFSCLLCKRQ